MAAPGTYTASLVKQIGDKIETLSEPQAFEVKPLRKGALEGASPEEVANFWREYEAAVRMHSAMNIALQNALKKAGRMTEVLANASAEVGDMDQRLGKLREKLSAIDAVMNGSKAKREVGEKYKAVIMDRLFTVSRGVDRSTYGATPLHRQSLEIANDLISDSHESLSGAMNELSELAAELVESLSLIHI